MRTNADVIRRIEEIETELRELRLTLTERENGTGEDRREDEFQIGEYVRVLNPRIGQESIARIVKINDETGYYTLRGKKFRQQIVRKKKNIKKIV